MFEQNRPLERKILAINIVRNVWSGSAGSAFARNPQAGQKTEVSQSATPHLELFKEWNSSCFQLVVDGANANGSLFGSLFYF